jgi:hypothetical protein
MWDSKTVIPPSLEHVLHAATLHQVVIKDLKDPQKAGRVRAEYVGGLGSGEENYTDWADFMGNTMSSGSGKTASGIWWPPQRDDLAYMGFKDGDLLQPFIVPGPVWREKPDGDEQVLPAEVLAVSKQNIRDMTRIRQIKDESGNTLSFSSIAGKEHLMLVNTFGEGLYLIAPGKGTDPKEGPNSDSELRTAFTREDKSVATQTAPKPGEVLKSKEAVMGLLGLNGGGLMVYSGDGKGSITLQASNANGETNGPSIFLDSKNSAIILTAGDTQLVINGQKGQVEVTKQVVQEKPKIDVETTIKNHKNFLKSNLSYFTSAGSSSSSSSGQSSGQSSSGSSSSGSLPPGSTSNFGNMAGFTG